MENPNLEIQALRKALDDALARLPQATQSELMGRFVMETELRELEDKPEPTLHDLRRHAQLEIALGYVCSMDDLRADLEARKQQEEQPVVSAEQTG